MALLWAAPQVIAQIDKFPPAIIAIAPPSVVIPSFATVLRVSGTNFAPGGVVFSRSSGVIVERTTVFGPTLAEIVVRVLAATPPGRLRLGFRNPNGGTSEQDGLPMQGGNEHTRCPPLATPYTRIQAVNSPPTSYLHIVLPVLDLQCATKGAGFKMQQITFLTCAPDPRGPGFGPNATANLSSGL